MAQLTLNREWLIENKIRGVFQAGMGDHPENEISVWNSANIKHQIYIEAYPPYAQICKNYCDSLEDDVKRLCISGALTEKDGSTYFFVNSQYLSHSVLDMYKNRPDVVKESMISVNRMEVDAYSIDSIFRNNNLNPEDYNLLFLDTQGSEHLVLKGAKDTLKYFDFIQIEISTEMVYENSILYNDWISLMESLGYKNIYEMSIPVGGVELGRDVTFKKNQE